MDPDPDAAASLARVLRVWGYEAYHTGDGRTALELARIHHPVVVLLDLVLPGMDVYALIRVLREESTLYPSLLIVVTSFDDPAERDQAQTAGADYFLIKNTGLDPAGVIAGDAPACRNEPAPLSLRFTTVNAAGSVRSSSTPNPNGRRARLGLPGVCRAA